MFELVSKINSLPFDEEGATMVEYTIMVALLAIVAVVITTEMGEEVSTTFSVVSASLSTVQG